MSMTGQLSWCVTWQMSLYERSSLWVHCWTDVLLWQGIIATASGCWMLISSKRPWCKQGHRWEVVPLWKVGQYDSSLVNRFIGVYLWKAFLPGAWLCRCPWLANLPGSSLGECSFMTAYHLCCMAGPMSLCDGPSSLVHYWADIPLWQWIGTGASLGRCTWLTTSLVGHWVDVPLLQAILTGALLDECRLMARHHHLCITAHRCTSTCFLNGIDGGAATAAQGLQLHLAPFPCYLWDHKE